jgi:hypothetical protein
MTDVFTPRPDTAEQGEIAAALAEFQKNIPVPGKDSSADTGKYTYAYASLDKLVPVLLPLLAEQGIAFTAVPDWTELGFGLRASLIHTSGQKIEGFYPLGSPNTPAQAIGSNISYARRYALLSLTGVAPTGEDDDGKAGNDAQIEANATEEKQATAKTTAKKETPASIRAEMGDLIDRSNGLITTDDANEIMNDVSGGKEIADWNLKDMQAGRDALKKRLAERQKGAK